LDLTSSHSLVFTIHFDAGVLQHTAQRARRCHTSYMSPYMISIPALDTRLRDAAFLPVSHGTRATLRCRRSAPLRPPPVLKSRDISVQIPKEFIAVDGGAQPQAARDSLPTPSTWSRQTQLVTFAPEPGPSRVLMRPKVRSSGSSHPPKLALTHFTALVGCAQVARHRDQARAIAHVSSCTRAHADSGGGWGCRTARTDSTPAPETALARRARTAPRDGERGRRGRGWLRVTVHHQSLGVPRASTRG
jgi:hypothetical protein